MKDEEFMKEERQEEKMVAPNKIKNESPDEEGQIEGAAQMGAVYPEEILTAITEVISVHPLADGLLDEQIKILACDAIDQGRLNDDEWLTERLEELSSSPENSATEKTASFEEQLKTFPVYEPVSVKDMEDLNHIVGRHESWIKSVLEGDDSKEGVRAFFQNCDLSGMSLNTFDLRCAKFVESKLIGTVFEKCDLSKAVFDSVDLSGVQFRSCKLKKTHFKNTDLSQCEFENTDIHLANIDENCELAENLADNLLKSEESKVDDQIDPFLII